MRKVIDVDAELKALADKAKALKERRVRQLGELVIASKADALDTNVLAGALLFAAANNDLVTREEWRKAGEGFFRRSAKVRRRARAEPAKDAARERGDASAGSEESAKGHA